MEMGIDKLRSLLGRGIWRVASFVTLVFRLARSAGTASATIAPTVILELDSVSGWQQDSYRMLGR